tara:strand:- start:384 stop:620 length:237 start_codon:yes stop_codon:yes gene_type:complete
MAYLVELYVLATALVTIASIICNYTDTQIELEQTIKRALNVTKNQQECSVFQGLQRVDNTTDAVTTAISARKGMVVED